MRRWLFVFSVLLCAGLALAAISNFSQIQCDSPYKVGDYEIIKIMTFEIDSLIRAGNYAVFTLHRGITTKRMDVTIPFDADSLQVDTMNVILRCGSDSMYVQLGDELGGTGAYMGNSTTEVDFATGAVCTLQVQNADGASDGGEGGYDAKVVLQFTDL